MNNLVRTLFICFVLLLPLKAGAFSISPLSYSVTVDPGTVENMNLEVVNNESAPRQFRISVSSLRLSEDGKIFYETGNDEVEKWLTAVPGSFTLLPGKKQTVRISAAVPRGTAPGTHTLAVITRAESKKQETIGLTGQSALPVMLTVAGVINERLLIQEWNTGNIYWRNNIPFSLVLKNDGNVNLSGAGQVVVTDIRGNKIAQNIYLGSPIFPSSLRQLRIDQRVENKFFPNRYAAEVVIKYGNSGSVIRDSVVFWYIPVWSMIAVPLILFSIIYYLWKKRGA